MHRCDFFTSLPVKGGSNVDSEAPLTTHSRQKKPYKPPIVTELGNVARLTAGANGSHFDPGHDTRIKRGAG